MNVEHEAHNSFSADWGEDLMFGEPHTIPGGWDISAFDSATTRKPRTMKFTDAWDDLRTMPGGWDFTGWAN